MSIKDQIVQLVAEKERLEYCDLQSPDLTLVADANARISEIDAEIAELQSKDTEIPDEPAPKAKERQPIRSTSVVDLLKNPTKPRWLIDEELEEGVIALLVGRRGTFKSFVLLEWAMQVYMKGEAVYIISAEGGDFDRRARAWLIHNGVSIDDLDPVRFRVIQARVDLNNHEAIEDIRADCLELGIRPKLFGIDTYSKSTPGHDENDNTATKTFIGKIDNGLKRAFDATVLLVAHAGLSDSRRVRGASALEADTDESHTLLRENDDSDIAVMTRQRFKDSAELPDIAFQRKVIDLGYLDDRGKPVTSLVLVRTDAPTKWKPSGEYQIAIIETLKEGNVELDDLVAKSAARIKLDPDAKRDRRFESAKRAVEKLLKAHRIFRHDDGLISLTRGQCVEANDDFDDLEGSETDWMEGTNDE